MRVTADLHLKAYSYVLLTLADQRFMGRLYWIISLALASCTTTRSVTQRYILDAEVDRLERVYTLWSDNTISLRPIADVPDYIYANARRGTITDIDTNNPLKVLVYYRDFMEIQVLDNTLSEITALSLDQLAYDDVRAVASSNDNNIWIYDAARYQLIKMDDTGRELISSINLTELSLNDLDPTDIKEGGNRVYLTDPEIGIIVFDNLGQYISTLPIKGISEVWVDRQSIIYPQGKRLMAYQQSLLRDTEVTLPEAIDTSYRKIIPSPRHFTLMYNDTVIQVDRVVR